MSAWANCSSTVPADTWASEVAVRYSGTHRSPGARRLSASPLHNVLRMNVDMPEPDTPDKVATLHLALPSRSNTCSILNACAVSPDTACCRRVAMMTRSLPVDRA
ncbi:hypothetical protein D3C84_1080900 [compost metagenome]